ncbi:hypothetical protein TYRP_001591 [Tyrophagus putrescentiae]|nr:hypothetical protein TYRP_001591 [Tyrophagus putrescentiae]
MPSDSLRIEYADFLKSFALNDFQNSNLKNETTVAVYKVKFDVLNAQGELVFDKDEFGNPGCFVLIAAKRAKEENTAATSLQLFYSTMRQVGVHSGANPFRGVSLEDPAVREAFEAIQESMRSGLNMTAEDSFQWVGAAVETEQALAHQNSHLNATEQLAAMYRVNFHPFYLAEGQAGRRCAVHIKKMKLVAEEDGKENEGEQQQQKPVFKILNFGCL